MVSKKYKKGKDLRGKSGREAKKGASGIAANYITRTKAIKKLQITLKDFRRLCILKGIFPRDPKKKKEGQDKTYYHLKDIQFLQHEPLLQHFRDLKIFLRRYQRAQIQRNQSRLNQLDDHRPVMTLDHLIRERYPLFISALRDMDDALNLLFLFSILPSGLIRAFTVEMREHCQRLTNEFLLYIMSTSSLSKVFITIKGIYYQCLISPYAERITFIIPHPFHPSIPSDVDYRIMFTFMQFYQTFMKFMNFKLYYDAELVYPPRVDQQKDEQRQGFAALFTEKQKASSDASASTSATSASIAEKKQPLAVSVSKKDRAKLQKQVNALVKELPTDSQAAADADDADAQLKDKSTDDDQTILDDFSALTDANTTSADTLLLPQLSEEERDHRLRRSLFSKCVFVLSREVPHQSLAFIIRCGGGRVRTEADVANDTVLDDSITHHVVDRPRILNMLPNRHYIQPQWVFDSFNLRHLVPVDLYAPGVIPPPHLSPFVDDEKEGYVPKQREIQRRWVEGVKDTGTVLKGENNEAAAAAEGEKMNGDQEELDDEERYEKELEKERQGVPFSQQEHQNNADDEDDDDDDDEDDENDEQKGVEDSEAEAEEAEDEEEAEASADEEEEDDESDEDESIVPLPAAVDKKRKLSQTAASTPSDEDLAKIMMPKKDARLYQRIQYGLQRKSEAAATLMEKRRQAEQKEQHQQNERQTRSTRQKAAPIQNEKPQPVVVSVQNARSNKRKKI